GIAGGRIRHGNCLLYSADRFGGRSLLGAAVPRTGAALKRSDAAIVELRTLQRSAFLGDALGAKRRIAAQKGLVLLALSHILLSPFAARLRPASRHRSGGQRRCRDTNETPSPHRSAPCLGSLL